MNKIKQLAVLLPFYATAWIILGSLGYFYQGSWPGFYESILLFLICDLALDNYKRKHNL